MKRPLWPAMLAPFGILFAFVAFSVPLAAETQQAEEVYRVGFLGRARAA